MGKRIQLDKVYRPGKGGGLRPLAGSVVVVSNKTGKPVYVTPSHPPLNVSKKIVETIEYRGDPDPVSGHALIRLKPDGTSEVICLVCEARKRKNLEAQKAFRARQKQKDKP